MRHIRKHRTSARPRRRTHLAAALALACLASLLTHVAPAAADGPGCDAAPGTDTAFVASAPAAERPALRAFEQSIRATGKLYLCADFVNAPAPLPTTGAGSVVRVRPIYPSPTGSTSFAMRVMYLTTTRTGTIVPTTTVVLVPRTHTTSGDRDTFVFTHGTIGINATCRNALDTALMALGRTLADPYLARDMVVVAPDYIGLGMPGKVHPYLTRVTTGRTVIDAMRAVRNLASVTLAGTDWVVSGHSQGALAAVATAEESATYGTASGLNLKGAVSLAGGGQLEDTLKLVMASPDRGNRFFVANALYGFKSDYPEINPATYLTAHADYAARTYLRDGNPYLNPFSPFEASMNTSGDPQYTTFVWGQGFVTHPAGPNLGWPLVPFSVPSIAPTQYYTPFASLMGLAYESEGLGPFGPYSIPEPEKDIRSCGYDLPHMVFQQLPANDFLKLPVANWDAGIKAILAANSLGTVGTSVPINYITGDADPLNPLGTQVNPSPGTAWASFAKLCQAGDSVEMNIYGADHSSVVLESLEDVEAWVVDRFADVPATDEC